MVRDGGRQVGVGGVGEKRYREGKALVWTGWEGGNEEKCYREGRGGGREGKGREKATLQRIKTLRGENPGRPHFCIL